MTLAVLAWHMLGGWKMLEANLPRQCWVEQVLITGWHLVKRFREPVLEEFCSFSCSTIHTFYKGLTTIKYLDGKLNVFGFKSGKPT